MKACFVMTRESYLDNFYKNFVKHSFIGDDCLYDLTSDFGEALKSYK